MSITHPRKVDGPSFLLRVTDVFYLYILQNQILTVLQDAYLCELSDAYNQVTGLIHDEPVDMYKMRVTL